MVICGLLESGKSNEPRNHRNLANTHLGNVNSRILKVLMWIRQEELTTTVFDLGFNLGNLLPI